MKKYNEIKFIKGTILIIYFIVITLALITFNTKSWYMPYINIGLLTATFIMLIGVVILEEHNRKIGKRKAR